MDFEDIETICVLGAGNMGHGIAEIAALAGYDVNLRDINEELVQDGYEQIQWSLEKLADQERISEDDAEAAGDSIETFVDVGEAVSDVDFIIEAVPEKMDIKKEVYTEVEEYAPERTIFATNTSSLSITELSEVTDRPEKFCGMHFFNPPVRMQLVEVITGAHTAAETLEITERLAEEMDKTPVRVRKDSPGFIVNRILVPLMNEATWIVHEGDATIEEVDSTVKYDVGLPMGPFELADLTGIDVGYHVLEYMNDVLGEAYEPCPLMAEKVESGELGKKTGKGYYDYEDGGVEVPADAGSEAIENRLLAVMANEAGKLIENDVSVPADIDEAVMLGGGFPEGPAKMADQTGLDVLVETLESLQAEKDHPRFAVSDYLREHADSGFYGSDDESSTSFDTVRVEYPAEHVGHVVLDRPHRMNSVSDELLDELAEAIDILDEDDEVRAILVTGEGDQAFCAGADVGAFTSLDSMSAIDISRQGQQTFGKLEEIGKPVVAGIDGYTLGGGMELAMCADVRVASERSEFGQPEMDLGLVPGWGGTQRLSRIVGEGRAREIILTADRYDAETMADYGFVNEVTGNEDLFERALDLTERLAGGPPLAHRFTKRAMLGGREDTAAGLELEANAFGQLIETDDLIEGVTAFMEDEEPSFEGE